MPCNAPCLLIRFPAPPSLQHHAQCQLGLGSVTFPVPSRTLRTAKLLMPAVVLLAPPAATCNPAAAPAVAAATAAPAPATAGGGGAAAAGAVMELT